MQNTSRILIAVLFFLAASPRTGEANLIVWEPFDYVANTEVDQMGPNALGLVGPYETTIAGTYELHHIDDAPLDHGQLGGPLPNTTGLALTSLNGITTGYTVIGVANGGIPMPPGSFVYFSALVQLNDSTGASRHALVVLRDSTTDDHIYFGSPLAGTRNIGVGADTSTSGGLQKSGADNGFVDGDVKFLVGRYLNSASPASDRLEMLVYDTADAHVLPNSFDPLDPGAESHLLLTGIDIDLALIDEIEFEIRGDGDNVIDELRIGRFYHSVNSPPPPPVVAPLLSLPATIVLASILVAVGAWTAGRGSFTPDGR